VRAAAGSAVDGIAFDAERVCNRSDVFGRVGHGSAWIRI
jgi:hypothetical protein